MTLTEMRQLQQYSGAIELAGLISQAWKEQTKPPKAKYTCRNFMVLSSLADNQQKYYNILSSGLVPLQLNGDLNTFWHPRTDEVAGT